MYNLKKKKLRIAFVVGSFPTVSETFIVNQICDLIDRGHEIRIFAFNRKNEVLIHQKIKGYALVEKTVFYKQTHVSKLKRYFPFLKFLFLNSGNVDFKKIFKNFRFKEDPIRAFNLDFFYKDKWILDSGYFDVIHAHFGPNAEYICKLRELGFLKTTKIVSTFHGYDMSPEILKNYRNNYSFLLEESDIITVNTIYSKGLIENLTSKKIEILPVGLDIEKFKGNKKINNTFQILFVGRLIELKGPNLAVEIFKLLKVRGIDNITLKIVGDGELKAQLLTLIADYNLKDSVKILGTKPQEEIIEVMSNSDVLIMPGIYDSSGRAETQGLVIQEAQSMRIPVIVSDVGGMKYGLIHGETGFVVKENNLDDFADKVEHLINDKNLATKMGEKGRWYISKNYNSKVLGEQLEALYSSVMV